MGRCSRQKVGGRIFLPGSRANNVRASHWTGFINAASVISVGCGPSTISRRWRVQQRQTQQAAAGRIDLFRPWQSHDRRVPPGFEHLLPSAFGVGGQAVQGRRRGPGLACPLRACWRGLCRTIATAPAGDPDALITWRPSFEVGALDLGELGGRRASGPQARAPACAQRWREYALRRRSLY